MHTGNLATYIASGNGHTCALLADSSIVCWGLNSFGQLGIGSTANVGSAPNQMGGKLVPVSLKPGISLARSIARSLPIASLPPSLPPSLPLSPFLALALAHPSSRTGSVATSLAAGDMHTCALLDGGGMVCWGRNDQGQLGVGSTVTVGNLAGQMGTKLQSVDMGPGRHALFMTALRELIRCFVLQKCYLCAGLRLKPIHCKEASKT
jgi:hypothetical protein